jgi:hypothetical protein
MTEIMALKPWASGPAEILQHAFELSQRKTDSSLRLALLTTDNALELMTKAYLGLPKRVSGIALPKKEYDEVCESFPRLIEALERVAGSKIEGIDLGAIEWFHRLRNELYHNGNGLTVPRSKVTAYFELTKLLYERLFEVSLEVRTDESGLVPQFIAAWVDLYKTLQRMVGDQLGEEFLQSTRSINDKLTEEEYLDDHTAAQIDRFRDIRNAVVHGDNYSLSEATLEAVRSLSERLRWQWETWKAKKPRTHTEAIINNLSTTGRTEKAWFHVSGSNGHGYILAMVNAKGSCSMRTFDAGDGSFLGRRYQSGNYQQSFASYLEHAAVLNVSHQPNLERECRTALPAGILKELQSQIQARGRDSRTEIENRTPD